jgi:hypothetical protein
MLDDQIIDETADDDEEEEEQALEQEELQSEIERLIEVLVPAISDDEIDAFSPQPIPSPFPESDMITKIAAAIARGKIHPSQRILPKGRTE